jgi:hypothetical protein
MRKTVMLLAALAALTPAGALAADGDLFKLFADVCLQPGQRQADVINRAKKLGFLTPPPSLAKTFKGGQVGAAMTVWRPFEAGMYLVIAGDLPFPGFQGVNSDACVVAVGPVQADAERQMQAGLGVGAPQKVNGQQVYVYQIDDAGKRTDAPSIPESLVRIAQQGRLRMAISKVDQTADSATFTLLTPNGR